MKTPEKIIREMRESVGTSVWTRRLADELESAMLEPVAEVNEDRVLQWSPPYSFIRAPGTKLYAFPPDAAAEIARLHSDIETAERALDAQTDFRAEIEQLKSTVANLERVAMRVHNFPSHPGGHEDDQSEGALVPEDWRHGWLCAAAAIQDSVMDARPADHSEQSLDMVTDAHSATTQNDIEALRRFARVHPDPATMEWFAQCATRYEMLREALQQIANRAIPIQREEHRIARAALTKEDKP